MRVLSHQGYPLRPRSPFARDVRHLKINDINNFLRETFASPFKGIPGIAIQVIIYLNIASKIV